jgi:hypothetical protein
LPSKFDVFLTADQKLPNQQNLATFHIAVVVFAGVSNRLRDLEPLVPKALEMLAELRSGTATLLR